MLDLLFPKLKQAIKVFSWTFSTWVLRKSERFVLYLHRLHLKAFLCCFGTSLSGCLMVSGLSAKVLSLRPSRLLSERWVFLKWLVSLLSWVKVVSQMAHLICSKPFAMSFSFSSSVSSILTAGNALNWFAVLVFASTGFALVLLNSWEQFFLETFQLMSWLRTDALVKVDTKVSSGNQLS